MSNHSTAGATLEKARFFAGLAATTEGAKRFELTAFLEAAIRFARSITWHLKKEYARHSGFGQWYGAKEDVMKSDPLFQLFNEERVEIVHRGPARIHKVVSIVTGDCISFSDWVELRVIRGKPWYRRRPKILWEDVRAAIMSAIRRWRHQRQTKLRRRKPKERPHTESTEDFFFDERAWQDRPVVDLFEEYLQKLEEIVDEAENLFDKRGVS